jgi:hypothetical protein
MEVSMFGNCAKLSLIPLAVAAAGIPLFAMTRPTAARAEY